MSVAIANIHITRATERRKSIKRNRQSRHERILLAKRILLACRGQAWMLDYKGFDKVINGYRLRFLYKGTSRITATVTPENCMMIKADDAAITIRLRGEPCSKP